MKNFDEFYEENENFDKEPFKVIEGWEDGESMLGDFIEDEQCMDPADVVMHSDLIRRLYENFGMLQEREQFVLRQRFGLDGGEPQTLAAIGEQLGISREGVRQIQKWALCKLRYMFAMRRSADG